MNKHTQGYWYINKLDHNICCKDEHICSTPNTEANAKRIVQCVNSHDELVEACKEGESAIHEALGECVDHFTIKHLNGYLEIVQEAIAKAESQQ